MNRRDIERVLETKDQSVLDFPDRGIWGDNRYRGNCSGWIQAFLIWKYQVKKMAELFAGSGTGSDVCRDMGVSYIGADLNPNPVRKILPYSPRRIMEMYWLKFLIWIFRLRVLILLML